MEPSCSSLFSNLTAWFGDFVSFASVPSYLIPTILYPGGAMTSGT